tara:strand:+ start:6706 stop:8640 length:1935 start_codon:yes stop_codon:yes gene_type:complete
MVEAKRVALVIGNSAYVNTSSLPNPVNDANIVADSARKAGFDDVVVALDLTVSSFQRELRTFREKANGADVAMIYYAGHGLEGQGENWLIPIDAKLKTAFDLPYESINLERMMESVSGARIRMVVLDACRNNPFGKGWASGTRTVMQGLAEFDADGVLVIYAAAPGQIATDGSGFNSPFAESLAKRLPQPDLPIQMLAGMIRDDVLAATGGAQRPFTSTNITGTPVYLVQAKPTEPESPAALAVTNRPNSAISNSARSLVPKPASSPMLLGSNAGGPMMNSLTGTSASPPPSVPELSVPTIDPSQRSEAELAYVPPTTAERELPALPPTPLLAKEGYPECRESYQVFEMPFDKAEDINQCTVRLDKYYSEILTPFRERMIEHQKAISQLYVDSVGGNMQYSPKSQDGFYEMMMKEHADSDPGGVNLADYRTAELRYQKDREYLQDRFCFNTGCGGYPVPEFDVKLALAQPKLRMDRSADISEGSGQIASARDAVDGRKKKKKKKKSDSKKCKGARTGGGLIGGILGGVIGEAAGLGDVGTLLASGLGALIGSEIACQLDQQEQEKAVEATMTVVEKEEVGAVATWQSPTRADVSGSSTVTALTAEPDGRKCLSITDVAIIDGEETKIAKQMCRGPGETNYSLMA